MKGYLKYLSVFLLCTGLCFTLAANPAKKPKKPAGPDKSSAEYLLDNSRIAAFKVDYCPAKKAFELFQKRTKAKIIYNRIRPNQERSVSLDIRRMKLRTALNEFKKYGYDWRRTGKTITIYPIGKPSEWKTGFGNLSVMDGNAAWISRARVRNVHLSNAPFAEVEKLLRKQRFKVSGLRTHVRVTLTAKNVTLKQFLTAVCMATGLDCVVNKQSIRFQRGSGIGYFLTNSKLKEKMVKQKSPIINKSLSISEFVNKSHPATAWVFLHVRGLNMAHFKSVVPVDVSGGTMADALDFIENNLNLRILYVENDVVVLIPHPVKAREAFEKRLKISVSGLKYNNASFKQILDDISKKVLISDTSRQGIPIVISGKLNPEKVTMNLPDTAVDELLRRLPLALGHYGYISRCGTSYVLVRSGLFYFSGIKITPLKPLVLQNLIQGGDPVDVPLDFESVEFKGVTVENILKFVKVLGRVRFGNRMDIRWVITKPATLRRTLSFKVDNPTLHSILDALAVRAKFNIEIRVGGVSVKDY